MFRKANIEKGLNTSLIPFLLARQVCLTVAGCKSRMNVGVTVRELVDPMKPEAEVKGKRVQRRRRIARHS